jgi:hypothetical protein
VTRAPQVALVRSAPSPVALPAARVVRAVPKATAPARARTVAPARPRTRHTSEVPPSYGCDGRPDWQQVLDQQVVKKLGYPVASLFFTVQFLPAHAGYTGLTDPGARRIQLFIRSCAQQSDALLLVTYAHEVGHAIDLAHLDQRRHVDWLTARGHAGAQWFGCGGCSDFGTGAGDFAETFAYFRTHNAAAFASTLAALPTPSQLHVLAPMFDVDY